MKYIALVLPLILFFLVVFPAEALVCRNYQGHQICILSIKRSAKNYWEYRAAVSVDGVKRPIEVYNCRDRIKVESDEVIVPFEDNDPGELICSYFQK
ncbi:MAG: hypothetical protein HXY43_23980 [Fischerella sp.]|jgi:hypothetical protein|uniref:hypothetical protein n=1 Tax=unclassified Fischerella TaxID=494603 RepID=UPI000479E879|nr:MULTISPECIES: hypothetical protein [unclassified Fischerella]NWF62228.1 hypothetical protein [Fischerella sp.]